MGVAQKMKEAVEQEFNDMGQEFRVSECANGFTFQFETEESEQVMEVTDVDDSHGVEERGCFEHTSGERHTKVTGHFGVVFAVAEFCMNEG